MPRKKKSFIITNKMQTDNNDNNQTMTEQPETPNIPIPSPQELYAVLNQNVIGQEEAKKRLAVAISNHFKRIALKYGSAKPLTGAVADSYVNVDKSNMLVLGNTGTGKTYMIKTIAKALGIPCFVADMTKVTESGYVGDDVEAVLHGLLREAKYDLGMAQIGICVLDEIDKIARKSNENMSITRDVSGEGVQQSLLKMVEGGVVSIPPTGGRKHPHMECIPMDTTDILFIGLGAFDGMECIISRRLNKKTVGFNTGNKEENKEKADNLLSKVIGEDLRQFGFIPELIGRFPVLTHTNPLTEDDMVCILTEPKDAIIKQYQALLGVDNIELTFSDDALRNIGQRAMAMSNGARSLRSIIENFMFDIMFANGGNTEYKHIHITADFLNEKLGPVPTKKS